MSASHMASSSHAAPLSHTTSSSHAAPLSHSSRHTTLSPSNATFQASMQRPRRQHNRRAFNKLELLPETTCHLIWAPTFDTRGNAVSMPTYYALYPSEKDAKLLYEDFMTALKEKEPSTPKSDLPLWKTSHDLHAKLLHRKERIGPGGNLQGMMDFLLEYENTTIEAFPGDIVYNQDAAMLEIFIDPSTDDKHKQFCSLFQFFSETCPPKKRQRNMPLHVLLATNKNNRQQTPFSAVLNLLRDADRKTLDLGEICGRDMDCPLTMTIGRYDVYF